MTSGRRIGSLIARLVLFAEAAFAVYASIHAPTHELPRGGQTLGVWFAGTCAGIAIAGALAIRTRWQEAVFGTCVLAFGMIGQLGVTSPLWIQYVQPPWELFAPSRDAEAPLTLYYLGFLLAQALCVGVRALGRAPHWYSRLRSWLTWKRAVVATILFLFAAANITQFIQIARDRGAFPTNAYAYQLAVALAFLILNVANLALIFERMPADAAQQIRGRLAAMMTLPGEEDRATRLDRALPWVVASFVFGVAVFLFHRVFELCPHIPDELAYIFQSKCLAHGQLWCAPPPEPKAFDVYLMTVEGGRWFATTPPGWPAVLAIGSFFGVPWIVNPILGALAIPLAHAVARRQVGRGFANALVVLLAASPWFLFLSASYMTHSVSLVMMLVAWLALLRARESGGGLAWPLIAGCALGYLCLVRQLDAVLVGGVFGLWILGVFGERLPWKSVIAYGIGCIAIAAVILPYNHAMTGHALQFPINAYTDKLWYPGANRLGFGADVGNPPGGWGYLDPFPGHGLRDVLVNTNQNLYATNVELFGWIAGSLLLAAIHLIGGRWTRSDRFLVLTLAVLFAGYHLYWFSGGPDFGARYWFLMIVPLVWLTLRGAQTLASAGAGGARVGVLIAACCMLTFGVFMPWRSIARYAHYRGFNADYRNLVETEHLTNDLVLVKAALNADFWSAFTLNDPTLPADRPIFAQDVSEESVQRLVKAWPERRVWRVSGRSSGSGVFLVESRPK